MVQNKEGNLYLDVYKGNCAPLKCSCSLPLYRQKNLKTSHWKQGNPSFFSPRIAKGRICPQPDTLNAIGSEWKEETRGYIRHLAPARCRLLKIIAEMRAHSDVCRIERAMCGHLIITSPNFCRWARPIMSCRRHEAMRGQLVIAACEFSWCQLFLGFIEFVRFCLLGMTPCI